LLAQVGVGSVVDVLELLELELLVDVVVVGEVTLAVDVPEDDDVSVVLERIGLQYPNCGWHPVSQYSSPLPHALYWLQQFPNGSAQKVPLAVVPQNPFGVAPPVACGYDVVLVEELDAELDVELKVELEVELAVELSDELVEELTDKLTDEMEDVRDAVPDSGLVLDTIVV
jgi:hypothetical protein